MADRHLQPEINNDNRASVDDANNIDAQPSINDESEMTRREILKFTASAVVAAPLVALTNAQAAGGSSPEALASQKKTSPGKTSPSQAPLFFTREEFALVDELTELIIPTDAHSPGARAAGVAAYIDKRLAESFEAEPKEQWRAGLKLIETISQEMHGRAFLQATAEQRTALLTRISQNEMEPKKPEETFFKELKTRTAHAYYTSKIGIHQEMEYKGNTYLKEFVGYDAK
jgi:hypothetical protein